jgi:Right handed beta helix region
MLRVLPLLLLLAAVAPVDGVPRVLAAGTGTTYYVRAGGSDHADGLSPQTAWASITRVNKQSLHPGDTVLFNGGDALAGQLYIAPGSGGTAAAPITFASYGSGRATISGGAGGAFFAYDAAGIAIANLNFSGAGAGANTKDGVSFYNDMAGGVKLAYIRVSGVDVSGFGRAGILVGGWNGSSGFTDVQVTQSATHNNGRGGLLTYGPAFNAAAPAYANSNVYVGHVSAYDNLGDPTLTTNSGSGIVLGSVLTGTIERSSAWANGGSCTASQCGAGIWTYDSSQITIQYDEAYSNRSAGHVDGDGFDLDQNVSSSFVQYNYSHDNGGAGFLDYSGAANAAHAGNTIRYNISQNDARANYGAITISGHVYRDAIYQNTVYVTSRTGGGAAAIKIGPGLSQVTARNNILDAAGSASQVASSVPLGTGAFVLQQNDYAGSFKVGWGASSFTSLAAWRQATGQELVSGAAAGTTADPGLSNPGGGGTVGNPDLLSMLSAYTLIAGSQMAGAGLDLQGVFGVADGGHDFYGVGVHVPPSIGGSEAAQ